MNRLKGVERLDWSVVLGEVSANERLPPPRPALAGSDLVGHWIEHLAGQLLQRIPTSRRCMLVVTLPVLS